MKPKLSPPDVQLLISSGCPHCANIIKILEKLIKSGKIGKLTIINIESHPEAAISAGTRSVPWTRIGNLEFLGAQSEKELISWVEHVSKGTGMAEYLVDLLENQQLDKAIRLSREKQSARQALLGLLADADTPMGTRIGIAAILEDLAEDKLLVGMIAGLSGLLDSPESRIRADACHYLGLTNSQEALPFLQKCLDDPDKEVREISKDALEMIT